MSRTTTMTRVAGFFFLFYLVIDITNRLIFRRATVGDDVTAKLVTLTQHVTDLRIVVVLTLIGCYAALVLAVALYAITRDENRDIAMLAMLCRVGEGITGSANVSQALGLVWLATASGTNAPDPGAAHAIGAFLLDGGGHATFFALGSTLFAYLFLRGRLIPAPLAWIGVLGSIMILVGRPLQLIGLLPPTVTWVMWIPLALFEVPLGLWLITRGVASPRPAAA